MADQTIIGIEGGETAVSAVGVEDVFPDWLNRERGIISKAAWSWLPIKQSKSGRERTSSTHSFGSGP